MIFARLNLLAITCAFMGQLSLAAQPYTNFNAAKDDFISFASQSGITFMLRQYGKWTTTQLVDRPTNAIPLTAEEITNIVKVSEYSPLQRFGIGQIGGNRVTITYDAPQVARMAGVRSGRALADAYRVAGAPAPTLNVNGTGGAAADAEAAVRLGSELAPEFEVREINTRTVTNLQEELTQLATDKASVKSVTFRGWFARQGGKVVGTLQLFFIAGSASNLAHSAYYAMNGMTSKIDTWEDDRCSQVQVKSGRATVCTPPGMWSYLLNTSDVIYYKFHADQ